MHLNIQDLNNYLSSRMGKDFFVDKLRLRSASNMLFRKHASSETVSQYGSEIKDEARFAPEVLRERATLRGLKNAQLISDSICKKARMVYSTQDHNNP